MGMSDNAPQVQRLEEDENPVQMSSLAQSITPVVQKQVDDQIQMKGGKTQASGDIENVTPSFKNYSDTINAVVEKYNSKFKPKNPLDPNWVRAMMMVESGGDSKAHKYDPLQVANSGDPALAVLQKGKEHTDLIIDNDFRDKLNSKKPTPWKNGKQNYQGLEEQERMNASIGIEAAVAWLFRKAANYELITEETDQKILMYTIKKGDSFDSIARKQGTTVDVIKKYNPQLNPKSLVPEKTTISYKKAHKKWVISSFNSWEKATEDYNGGGDPQYLDKVKKQYNIIKSK
jgi:LysM repeat protein